MAADISAMRSPRAEMIGRRIASDNARHHLRFADYQVKVEAELGREARSISGADWFAPMAALTCVASALGGLSGLLMGAADADTGLVLGGLILLGFAVMCFMATKRSWGDPSTAARQARFVEIGMSAASREDAWLRAQSRWPGAEGVAREDTVWTFSQVERLAAKVMRQFGARDAAVTRLSGDGGIDVESHYAVAQVKHWAARVPPAEITYFAEVAARAGKLALFFSTSGYSPGAVRVADEGDVALFTLRTGTMRVEAANEMSKIAMQGKQTPLSRMRVFAQMTQDERAALRGVPHTKR
ncbi:restriction endonuclease [Georgenia daeguensis]|uniref:Restriction endonuclease type IV Mrr domain-containing protein n=1 Tax=Georgenia daeguensis TaxID=908355 RepID=A0ABP6UNI8_9MICO